MVGRGLVVLLQGRGGCGKFLGRQEWYMNGVTGGGNGLGRFGVRLLLQVLVLFRRICVRSGCGGCHFLSNRLPGISPFDTKLCSCWIRDRQDRIPLQ